MIVFAIGIFLLGVSLGYSRLRVVSLLPVTLLVIAAMTVASDAQSFGPVQMICAMVALQFGYLAGLLQQKRPSY